MGTIWRGDLVKTGESIKVKVTKEPRILHTTAQVETVDALSNMMFIHSLIVLILWDYLKMPM